MGISHLKRRLGRTFVAIRRGESKVLGYYTLASSAVAFRSLPADAAKRLPRHPVPVVLLARLAVDTTLQGQGLGRHLLVDAMHRSLALADQLGVYAIEVDAVDDEAGRFYDKYGFVALVDDPRHLYLPLATVQQVFAPARRGG